MEFKSKILRDKLLYWKKETQHVHWATQIMLLEQVDWWKQCLVAPTLILCDYNVFLFIEQIVAKLILLICGWEAQGY